MLVLEVERANYKNSDRREYIQAAVDIKHQIPPSSTENPQLYYKLDIWKFHLQTIAQEHGLPLDMFFNVHEMKKHLWNVTLELSSLGGGWREKLIDPGFLAWLSSATTFSMKYQKGEGLLIQQTQILT